MDRYKNRDQEIAPTDIGYRDFVVSCWVSWWAVSCGSGLLTAIWVNEIAVRRPLPQEISHKVMEPTVRDRKIAEYPCAAFSVA